MAIVTANHINSVFSNIVSDYLNKGYVISTGTMSGCFSREICHIDLKHNDNPNEMIRVWLLKDHSEKLQANHTYSYVNIITISVKKYDSGRSFWYDAGEQIGTPIVFYQIKDHAYTDSLDECKSIIDLREERFDRKYIQRNVRKDLDLNKVSINVKDLIINRIREVPGANRAKGYDCIKRISLEKDSNNRLYCESYWEFNNRSGKIILK